MCDVLWSGGSAGGFTALAALTFRNVFRTGASHYGVADLNALAADTHKFEARYLDSLIAPYPEGKRLYDERSPLAHVHKLTRPIALFQGLDDKVVPPNQTQLMYDSVKAKGLTVSVTYFEGEGHGFRQAKNIRAALDGASCFSLAFTLLPAELRLGLFRCFR
jgi:dipeptidyl aminopeptidase/acylaminoacyl peptidase